MKRKTFEEAGVSLVPPEKQAKLEHTHVEQPATRPQPEVQRGE